VLYELGRIKEAMAVSAPLLPGGTVRAGSDVTCQALALWIDGALDLAVSAPAIERVLTMLENHVDSTSELEWRGVQFHLRVRLLIEQGELDLALAHAKEGWALWRHRPELLVPDIAYLARNLMRGDDVRRLLAELARMPAVDGELRQWLIRECEYAIAMVEGRHDDAVRAQEAIAASLRHRSNSFVKLNQLLVVAEVRASAQHVEQARRDAVQLAPLLHTSLPGLAYAYRELLGDIHLGAARRALGLPSIDPDIPVPGEVSPPDGAGPVDPAAEVRRARLAYRAAQPFADRLDTAFGGTRNRDRLRKRLRLLDEL
jgi:hypothetical protein